MKRIAMICAVTMLAASLCLAQDAAKPEVKPEAKPAMALPSADQILDNYVKAIGGKAAVEKLTSRIAKGTFEMPAMNINGTFDQYAKAPNMIAVVVDIPGFGMVREGFDGKTAWANDPQSGLRDKSGAELVAARIDADFHKDIKYKQLYAKLEVKGKEKVAGRDAYVIVATPSEGEPEKLYFDVENALLVRQDTEREGPQGKMPAESYLSDYREVDGVKMPFTMRQVTPMFEMLIKNTEVKHNGVVDEAKFKKPAQ